MKKFHLSLLIMLLSILLFSSGASAALWGTSLDATDWTGTRDSSTTGGLTAEGTWVNGGITVDWTVTYAGGYYTYLYDILTADGQGIGDLSHFTLEVTNDGEDFIYRTSATGEQVVEGPQIWDEGPNNFYGVKFDYSTDGDNNSYTIITNRAPVWGVAYFKDGSANAWTSALNFSDFMTNDALTELNFIARPNGFTQVPEPATMLLLGAGLLGLVGIGRKKLFK